MDPKWRSVRLATDSQASAKPVLIESDLVAGFEYQAPTAAQEFGGGYAYTDGRNDPRTRNRVLHWHCNGNILELHESSLDLALQVHTAKFSFKAAIFGDIFVEEIAADNVNDGFVCLQFVLADGTLHRLGFLHPLSTPLDAHSVSILSQLRFKWFISTGFSPMAVSGGGDAVVVADTDGAVLAHFLPTINGAYRNEEYDFVSLYNKNVVTRFIAGLTRSTTDRIVCSCSVRKARQCTVFTLSNALELRAFRVDRGNSKNVRDVRVMSLTDCINDPLIAQANLVPEKFKIRVCDAENITRGMSYVGVYVASTVQSVVMLFQCKWNVDEAVPRFKHIANKLCTFGSLTDFKMTPEHLWFVATAENGNTVAFHTPLGTSVGAPCQVTEVSPTTQVSDAVVVPTDRDPREIYLEHIFGTSRFSSTCIADAVGIFSGTRVVRAGAYDDAFLKARVTKAVEDKVRAQSYELDYDQLRQIEINSWDAFLQSCLHFWGQENKVQGLFGDTTTGFMYLVKKRGLEMVAVHKPLASLIADPVADGARADLLRMFDCMEFVSSLFGSDTPKQMFDSPHQYASAKAAEVLQNVDIHRNIGTELAGKLADVVNMASTVEIIMDHLTGEDLDEAMGGNADAMDDGNESNGIRNREHLFANALGVSLIANELRHHVNLRLQMVRNLLFALCLAFRLRRAANISSEVRGELTQTWLPRVSDKFQELYVLNWIASTSTSAVSQESIEASMRHLSIIGSACKYKPQLIPSLNQPSLLELFVSEPEIMMELHDIPSGVADAYNHRTWGRRVLDSMTMALLPLIKHSTISTSSTSRSPNVEFCKFLLQRCQLEELHSYILLLGVDCGPSAFLLAQIQLRNGELHKAKSNFLRAASAIGTSDDTALRKLVGLSTQAAIPAWLSQASYFIKVMEFFKESIPRNLSALDEASKPAVFHRLHSPQIVISFAQAALNAVRDVDDSQTNSNADALTQRTSMEKMLWTSIFQFNLDLGNADEAFIAAMSNPAMADPDDPTRGDCLQQLISVLCERDQYQAVVEFPYSGAQSIALDILQTKAKNLDVLAVIFDGIPNYYRVLYAFQIHRSDFHAAALAMFEYALRLAAEVSRFSDEQCVTILTHQRNAFLIAINALRLVDEEHAWFVRPQAMSMKRKFDSDQPGDASNPALVEVLSLDDLLREYIIIIARLQLLQSADETIDVSRVTSRDFSAVDAITMLANEGMFDFAFTIAKHHRSTLPPKTLANMFVILADKCARLTIDPTLSHAWLHSNDVDLGPAMPKPLGNSDALDEQSMFSTVSSNPAGAAWEFLRLLLRLYDSDSSNNYEHHICVVDRVMQLRVGGADSENNYVPLPKWLVRSLRVRHPTALLKLYTKHNNLAEATALALSLIQDATPRTSDDSQPLAIWLPHTELENLQSKLQRHAKLRQGTSIGQQYRQFADDLHKECATYFNKISVPVLSHQEQLSSYRR